MREKEFWKLFRADFGVAACADYSVPVIDMFSSLFEIARENNVFCENVSNFPKDFIKSDMVAFLKDADNHSKCILVEFVDYPVYMKIKNDDKHRIAACPIIVLDDYADFKLLTNEYTLLCDKFKKESE